MAEDPLPIPSEQQQFLRIQPDRKETIIMKVRTTLKAGANPFTDPDG
jgi:hypothetical protein